MPYSDPTIDLEVTPRTAAPPRFSARPYRLEPAEVPVYDLYSTAELRPWLTRTHPEIRPLVREALEDDERVPLALIQRMRDHCHFNTGRSDLLDPELWNLLVDRAVRTAHLEGILWSPLMRQVVYGPPPAPEPALGASQEEIDYYEQGLDRHAPARGPVADVYWDALAGWMGERATPEDLQALLCAKEDWLFPALLDRLSTTAPDPSLLLRLYAARPMDGEVLLMRAAWTPEAAGVLANHLLHDPEPCAGTAPPYAAFRHIRKEGLWEWKPKAGESERLLGELRCSRAEGALAAAPEPTRGEGADEADTRAVRHWSNRESLLAWLLATHAGLGPGFPSLDEVFEVVRERGTWVEALMANPRTRLDQIRTLVHYCETEHPEWVERGIVDIDGVLMGRADAVADAGFRERLMRSVRTDVLERLVGALDGDERRLTFRRLGLLEPWLAGRMLESDDGTLAGSLCPSDLSVLLASPSSRDRMRALQFIGNLDPESAEDCLGPPPLETEEVARHGRYP
jgi:hypothetical protein